MALIGQQLGHYRILRLLAQGGMGEVYLAEDTRIERQVAIKVVLDERGSYPNADSLQQAERYFQREMRAISQLDHPYILSFYDFGEQPAENGTIIYMVMPYRAEGSLNDWLNQRGSIPLPPKNVAAMISQAASALQHAHDHGIIHQDVKPSNFLIRIDPNHPDQPELFLADFGIARVMTGTSNMSKTVKGTATYMAPEQWSGNAVPASDQYALAVMAYQLLTGQLLFQGRSEQVMYQHMAVAPNPPSQTNSNLSPAIDAVLLRALAKNADDRFPRIEDFAQALQQAVDYTDLRSTLTINNVEARQGGTRMVTLPGNRQVSVTIPPNAYNGQLLQLPGLGMPFYPNGPRGPLALTLAVEQSQPYPFTGYGPAGPGSNPGYAGYPNMGSNQYNSMAPTYAQPSQPSLTPNYQGPAYPPLPPAPSYGVAGPSVGAPPQFGNAQQPSASRRSSRLLVPIVVIVLVLLIASILTAVLINNQNVAQSHAHATATVQTASRNATGTAQAQATAQVRATSVAATATVTANPYTSTGSLSFFDALNETSNPNWDSGTSTSGSGGCQPTANGYQVSESNIKLYDQCFQKKSTYNNFAFEVKMTIDEGNCGGMIFRSNSDGSKLYDYLVCEDGSYALYKYVSNSSSSSLTVSSSSAIKTGVGQTNIIAVVANGNSIGLYVNTQKIASVNDSSYTQGNIGLVAAPSDHATQVTYQDARVWSL
jgi:serine/threonine protein kinase